MPESVTDRCTKAHEYVFLFAHPDSGGKYFYDNEAVREQCTPESVRNIQGRSVLFNKTNHGGTRPDLNNKPRTAYVREDYTRNKRSVWNVNPRPYAGAHFAVWPPELVRPMILAGCPVGGTVLDPFSGSATTGMVALQEGRNYVGCDLNPDYLPLAVNRIQDLPAPQPDAPVEEGSNVFDLFSDG